MNDEIFDKKQPKEESRNGLKKMMEKISRFFKSIPSSILKALKWIWPIIKTIPKKIESGFKSILAFILRVKNILKSLFEKGKVLLMKLWKKLLPLIIVVLFTFPFVGGWIVVEQPDIVEVPSHYEIAPTYSEILQEGLPEDGDEVVAVDEDATIELSPEAMLLVIGVVLAVLMQLYKVNQSKNGKGEPKTELINWVILAAGSVILWYGENFGLDMTGLAQEFPQFSLESLNVKGLFELLADLLGTGSSVLGPTVAVYSILKRTLFSWVGAFQPKK